MSAPTRADPVDAGAVEELVIVVEASKDQPTAEPCTPPAAASANTLSPLLVSSVLGGSLRSLSGPGPGPSKQHIHVITSPAPTEPRAHCHRHIDTVFVVVVLLAMLVLVIAECISMKRF